MIKDMLTLYLRTPPPHDLRKKTKERNGLQFEFYVGNCPLCQKHSFCFYENSKHAKCLNCEKDFTMISFCREVFQLDDVSIVKFILGKDGDLNALDYKAFALAVHSHIKDELNGSRKIVFDCPDDREPISVCPHCGGQFFCYVITEKGNVSPYCLFCGGFIQGQKKIRKNQKRPAKASAKWAEKVALRYNGKCALCGSAEGLEAHHIIPYSIDEENRFNVDNGILLCKRHHDMAHQKVWVK